MKQLEAIGLSLGLFTLKWYSADQCYPIFLVMCNSVQPTKLLNRLIRPYILYSLASHSDPMVRQSLAIQSFNFSACLSKSGKYRKGIIFCSFFVSNVSRTEGKLDSKCELKLKTTVHSSEFSCVDYHTQHRLKPRLHQIHVDGYIVDGYKF